MKRSVRLLVAVGVVAVLAVVLVLLQNTGGNDASVEDGMPPLPDDSERVAIIDIDREAVERVEVENELGRLTFLPEVNDEGRLLFAPVYEFDVAFDQQAVNRVIRSSVGLTSRRVIGEVDDLADYGLADPRAAVTVTTTEGVERLYVGSQTPARDGYYVRREGDPTVYSVFRTWVSPLLSSLDALRLRVIPQIAAETLEGIDMTNLEGERVRIRRRLDTETDPELTLSGFVTVAPYNRPYQTRTTWMDETVIPTVEALEIGRFVDDNPTNLSQYGLNPPRARFEIRGEDQVLSLQLGETTDGGRFARFADGGSVFVLRDIEPIISTSAYETISPFVLLLGIDLIDRVVVDAGTEEFTLSVERTPVPGEDDPEDVFFLNGGEIDEDLGRDLYQWAIGLQMDADGATVASGQPVATVTFYFVDGSEPRSASFVPAGPNFLAVVRNGRSEFLIARSKIQRMIRAFREAEGN